MTRDMARTAAANVAEVLFLLIAPVIAVLALRISLIDQFGYVDPEYYSGYGQSFHRMWNLFGVTYYAARFPVMFLNLTSQRLAPGIAGYAIVRALVFGGCALPLYALARQHYGRAVALGSYVFLIANPLMPRVLCWENTTFLSIPAGLAGIALWYGSPAPVSLGVIGSGFAFGVSMASHVFTGTAISVFLAVEAVFALRRPRWFLARCGMLAVGLALCLACGVWFYHWQVGGVSLSTLWWSTVTVIGAGQQYAETHYIPIAAYYSVNYELYVPLLTTLFLVVLNRDNLFKNCLQARITWFSITYVAAYLFAVFVMRMNIVQYFWYFEHLTIVVYLGIAVILGQLARRCGHGVVFGLTGALIVVALAVRAFFPTAYRMSAQASGNGRVVAVFVACSAVCAIAMAARSRMVVHLAAVAAGVLLQVPFLSSSHLSVYDTHANEIEIPLFRAVTSYHALLNRYDTRDHRVRSWYVVSDIGLSSLASSNLLYTLQDPFSQGGMPAIGEREREILRDPSTGYILLLARTESDVSQGISTLQADGIGMTRVEQTVWGAAPMVVHATLVKVEH